MIDDATYQTLRERVIARFGAGVELGASTSTAEVALMAWSGGGPGKGIRFHVTLGTAQLGELLTVLDAASGGNS